MAELVKDSVERKQRPIARGVLDYFPLALAEVAHVSYVGNRQHNGDGPMHWAKDKSPDHADCIARHLIERGTLDTDGLRHTAKVAWRALALLQIELEGVKEMVDKAPYRQCRYHSIDLVCFHCRPERFPDITGVKAVIADAAQGEPGHKPRTKPACKCGDRQVCDVCQGISLHDAAKAEPAPKPGIEFEDRELFGLLSGLGCTGEVACSIIKGIRYAPYRFGERRDAYNPFVYVAGPMRGKKDFNFPQFDAARDSFRAWGYNVISPADIDRAAGDSVGISETQATVQAKDYLYRDFYALYLMMHIGVKGKNAVAFLPGWEMSTGALAEFAIARWLGLRILDATTGDTLRVEALNTHDLCRSISRHLMSLLV